MGETMSTAVPKKLSPEEFERRKQIGSALRKLREHQGLTIDDAARAADVSYHTWCRWEGGKTAIPLELVANIRTALKSSLIFAIEPHLRAA